MKKIIFTTAIMLLSVLGLVQPNLLKQTEAVNTYNLTYELFGGTNNENNPSSYTDTQTDFNLLPASKSSLTFQGWYKSEGFRETDRVDALPGNDSGVTKLYAKWGPLLYKVDFVSNGGSSVNQQPAIQTFSVNPNSTFLGVAEVVQSYASIARDLNGDGKGDLITFNNGDRHIYYSHPTQAFSYTKVSGNLMSFVWAANFFDINQDGLEDLIVVGTPNFTYSLRQPNGSLGTETAFTLQTGGVSYSEITNFDMADIDGDGLIDVAFAANGKIVYLLNQGNFTFGPAVLAGNVSNYGRGVKMFDLNQDGNLDIIGTSESNAFIKWGDGLTPFGGSYISIPFSPYRPFVSDINKDNFYEMIGVSNNWALPGYVRFNPDLTSNLPDQLPGSDRMAFVNWVGDEMDINGDNYADIFYVQLRDNSGMAISRGDGTYYTQQFNLQEDINSGTIVYDPAFGTFGMMGSTWSSPNTRYYSVSSTQSVSHLASISPSRNGYTFQGWYEDSNLTGNLFNFSVSINANKTLYAKWEPVNYNINYFLNGGTNHPSNPGDVNIENPTYTLQDPSKPGSRFLGWFSDSGFTTSITSIPANSTTSFNIYAKWLDPITVTFNVGGGSSTSSISNLPGEVLTQPQDPTRNGYAFAGWFTNNAFTMPYSFTTIPIQSTTIFAKWTALSFDITFITNGGSPINSLAFNTDQTLSLPVAPTKVGHTFAGWYTNQALTTRFTGTKMVPNDFILYAKWNVNIHQLSWSIGDKSYDIDLPYGSTLQTILPTPSKYEFEFLGWSIDGDIVINVNDFTMPDEDVSLIALFKDNVPPVVFTVTDGDTYAGGVDIIFNEGIAQLDGQPIESGYRINLPGTYSLILTDEGGNVVEVTFTVIEAVDNSNLRWIIFASILGGTWLFLAILYLFNRQSTSGGSSGGGSLAMNRKAPKPVAVVHKKTIKEQQPVEKPKVVKTKVAPSLIVPQVSTPKPVIKQINPEVTKPVEVKKPESKVDMKQAEPKVEIKKPLNKVPPMPIVKAEEINQQLTETVIFKKPLKINVDPAESFKPELKTEFNEVFVSDKRKVQVPELTYISQTTNVTFYTNLFRYIHRFAGVLSEGLLGSLTQSVIKLTDDKEAQLKIVEASTRTAEGLKTNQNQDYLLKILRRNVALNRDVLNPRNKYVHSYQRLATLLEELGIYGEAAIVVREAYERGLVDTPDATFEKRLSRLEKKLIDSGGLRQDMLRK